jgi:hypothetical protein
MAFASTVTVTQLDPVGKEYLHNFIVDIAETGATATDESVITGLPSQGRIIRQICIHTAGTATTVDPVLGSATNPAGAGKDLIMENATAAATVDNMPSPAIPYYSSTGTLYHRSVSNGASTDNSHTVRYFIRAGWSL